MTDRDGVTLSGVLFDGVEASRPFRSVPELVAAVVGHARESAAGASVTADIALHDAKMSATERNQSLVNSHAAAQVLRALPATTVGVAVAVDFLLVAYSFPDSMTWMAVIVAFLVIGLLTSRGLYDFQQPRPWSSRLYAIVSSTSIAFVGAVMLSPALGQPAARSWSVAGAALAVAAVAIWHAGIGRGYTALTKALIPPRRVIVVGANPAGQDAARALEQDGYQVVGYADEDGALHLPIDRPLLGPIARLDELVESLGIDEVVIAIGNERKVGLRPVLTRGFARRIQVKYAVEFGDLRLPPRFDVRRIGKRQYIDFAPVARVSWTKRAMDLAIAATALIALLPVFAVIAIAVKLESPGPAFYGSVRVGKDRRFFRMLKFRSMRQDAETLISELLDENELSGPMFKIRNDPRVTRVGRLIRRASLDELPQLINVVRGDMSLVGPRPPLAAEVAKYQDWEIGRLRAVPGITGLWQVSGRTEVPFQDMVRLDLHYVRNWSLALDVEILLRTVPAVLTTKGAY